MESNNYVDHMCHEALDQGGTADIYMPTGGHKYFFMTEGRMWTTERGETIRAWLRAQALTRWSNEETHPRQGLTGRLIEEGQVYLPALELRRYTNVYVPKAWRWLLLEGDDPAATNLSRMAYRLGQSVGGGWTEALHADAELAKTA